jgi:hypothetical protein
MAIFNQDDSILSIYNSEDILQCFQNIEKNTPLLTMKLDDKQFKVRNIKFDLRDKYLALASET